jgi:hypothetical protein
VSGGKAEVRFTSAVSVIKSEFGVKQVRLITVSIVGFFFLSALVLSIFFDFSQYADVGEESFIYNSWIYTFLIL